MEQHYGLQREAAFPRLLRPVEPALALYLRPGRDHGVLAQSLTEGLSGLRGVVLNPARVKAQQDLRLEAARRSVETILDTRMMELSSPSAEQRQELISLGWAFAGRKPAEELRASAGQEVVKRIADFVVSNGFSAVLAPTHYLASADDHWIPVDRLLTEILRDYLDARGGSEIPIYYPLALPSAAFRKSSQRREIIRLLKDVPIDSIWLRVHPFGTTNSGPVVLRGYIEACQEFHQLRIPLVAERTGTVGIALLAFGAVGGIESGITIGESFDIGVLMRAPNKGRRPFLPSPRVYLKDLGAFLDVKGARKFFDLRQMKAFFGCREQCCPRGLQDMLGDPRKHFIATRAREVARISSVPVTLRRRVYMEEFLRPATDKALQASRVYPALERQRRIVESWRGTLSAVERETLSRLSPRRPMEGGPVGRELQRDD